MSSSISGEDEGEEAEDDSVSPASSFNASVCE